MSQSPGSPARARPIPPMSPPRSQGCASSPLCRSRSASASEPRNKPPRSRAPPTPPSSAPPSSSVSPSTSTPTAALSTASSRPSSPTSGDWPRGCAVRGENLENLRPIPRSSTDFAGGGTIRAKLDRQGWLLAKTTLNNRRAQADLAGNRREDIQRIGDARLRSTQRSRYCGARRPYLCCSRNWRCDRIEGRSRRRQNYLCPCLYPRARRHGGGAEPDLHPGTGLRARARGDLAFRPLPPQIAGRGLGARHRGCLQRRDLADRMARAAGPFAAAIPARDHLLLRKPA